MSALVFESFLSTPEMLAVFSQRVGAAGDARLRGRAGAAPKPAEGVIPAARPGRSPAACQVELLDVDAIVGASAQRRQPRDSARQAADRGRRARRRRRRRLRALGQHQPGRDRHRDGARHAARARAARRAISARLIEALFALADAHGDAPMLARTLMQPAQVVSFGFKLVAWLAPLVRARERLRAQARARAAAAARRRGRHARGARRARRRRWRGASPTRSSSRLAPGAWHTQRDEWVRARLRGRRAVRLARQDRAATWRCWRRPRSASSPSRRAPAAAARRRCRTSATRSRR